MPRCWAYETAISVNEDLPNGLLFCINLLELPEGDYFEYFAPEYKLHLPVSNMEN